MTKAGKTYTWLAKFDPKAKHYVDKDQLESQKGEKLAIEEIRESPGESRELYFEARENLNVYTVSNKVGNRESNEAILQNKDTGTLTFIPDTHKVSDSLIRHMTGDRNLTLKRADKQHHD